MSHALFSLPWHEILMPKPSWAEKLLRPVIIYVALLIMFRLVAKRELAQATLFDFLIILLISNVVQNAIIGEDNSVLGALGGAVMLLGLSALLNRITAGSKQARFLLEGKPVLLVRDGAVNEAHMKQQAVSRNDLFSAIRKQGIPRLDDVAYAILELDGSISVIKQDDDKRPNDCLPPEIVGEESKEDNADNAKNEKKRTPQTKAKMCLAALPTASAMTIIDRTIKPFCSA